MIIHLSSDEVRLSSKDLETLLQAGNLSFEGLDLLQLDPNVAQQILQFKQQQTGDYMTDNMFQHFSLFFLS
jgi:hypothetical protein